ncbi:MAG TPA: hypothetical protein ENI23_02960 [bacterium]|nr:hypothetical protein [bacterium]
MKVGIRILPKYAKFISLYTKHFYPLDKMHGTPLMQFTYIRAREAVAHTERNMKKLKLRKKRFSERGKKYPKAIKKRYKSLKKEQIKLQELERARNETL